MPSLAIKHLIRWVIVMALMSIVPSIQALSVHLNGLVLGIDERTGSLVYLAFPEVGEFLRAEPESAGLLDVAYPIDAFAPMRLASRSSRARTVTEADGVTITWDQLGPSRSNFPLPSGKVSAIVKLRSAPDGKSVILTCRLENHSQAPVPQILFPDFHGFEPFAGLTRTELRFGRGVVQPFLAPLKAPGTAPFYALSGGWSEYPATGYYGLNAIRWIDFGSLGGGISIFQKKWGSDDRPDVRTHRSSSNPMAMRLCWEHKTPVQPGQVWESGEFWLTPHEGGWAKGIEIYRDYVRQVYPPRELPVHVRDGLGFQTVWESQATEPDPAKAAFLYSDLPRLAKDALEHGIDELVSWAPALPFVIPITVREELGGRREFVEAARGSKAIGVNLAPFFSVQLVVSPLADRYGVKPDGRGWTYHPDFIPNFNPFYSSVNATAAVPSDNATWQKDLLASFTDWINAGVFSFGWDVGDTRFFGKQRPPLVGLIQKIRDLARAADPQSTFNGESVTSTSMEWDGMIFDYTWNWVNYEDAAPLTNVLRAPRLNCNIEDSPLVVKKAFIDNLYLNVMPKKPDQPNGTASISENPALSAALKQVAARRRQFLPYFTAGTFIGDCVLSERPAAFVRAYQLPKKLLILVLNDRVEKQQVSVRSRLDLWLPSTDSYQVRLYDSTGKLVNSKSGAGNRWSEVTAPLEYLDMAFIEIAAQ